MLDEHPRQQRNAGTACRPLIGLDPCFRQEQRINGSCVFGINQLLPELGLLQELCQSRQHLDVRLLQLSANYQEHNQLHALTVRHTVINPPTAAAQHDTKITLPVHKGVRQGKI